MALDAHDLARLSPDAQKQILAQLTAPKKQNKYRNKRTKVNGITFASQHEANRYLELIALQAAGKIRLLKLQPELTLMEGFRTIEGKKIRAERYVADFCYERETLPDCYGKTYWVRVYEDAKGKRTDVYKSKRKRVKDRYNIDIEEV